MRARTGRGATAAPLARSGEVSHQEAGMSDDTRKKKTRDAARGRPTDADCVKHRENLLDDALDDSFPASDPPALSQPARRRC